MKGNRAEASPHLPAALGGEQGTGCIPGVRKKTSPTPQPTGRSWLLNISLKQLLGQDLVKHFRMCRSQVHAEVLPWIQGISEPSWGNSHCSGCPCVPAISVLLELCPHWLGGAHRVNYSHLGWAGAVWELCVSSAPGWSKHHNKPTKE